MNTKLSFKQHMTLIFRGLKIFAKFPRPVLISRTLSNIFTALIPFINIWFSARIINELVGERDQNRLIFLVSLTIGLNLLANLIGSALNRWRAVCVSQNWYVLFNLTSEKMLSLDYTDTENPDIQTTHSNINQHTNGMGFGLTRLIGSYDRMVGGLVRVVLSVAFAFTLFTYRVPYNSSMAFLDSPLIVAAVLVVLACNIFLGPLISARGGKILVKGNDINNRGNRFWGFYFFTMVRENSRAKDIRIYDQKHMIDDSVKDIFSASLWMKIVCYFDNHNAVAGLVTQLSNGLIYLFVALKAFAGAFPVGNIVQYAGAIMQFGEGFGSLIMAAGELGNNNPYMDEVIKFLDTPTKMYKGTRPVDVGNYEIEFKNVSFKYPGSDSYALSDLSMKLNVGQRLAVVGMNGSGKTTMIKLLCRLYDPTEGEITLNGINIREYDYAQYLSIFGVVFQDFGLLPFTLGQNVATDVEYDADRVRKCLSQAGFDDKLSKMPNGLDTYLYKNFEDDGVEVSGGEAQKIALARALYKNSPFIVLDEPTAALDPIAEYEIYSTFNEIVGDKTAVYISHRLSSCRFCDDIAVFHEGELVQRGNHDVLVANELGKYRELWDAQAQYYAQ